MTLPIIRKNRRTYSHPLLNNHHPTTRSGRMSSIQVTTQPSQLQVQRYLKITNKTVEVPGDVVTDVDLEVVETDEVSVDVVTDVAIVEDEVKEEVVGMITTGTVGSPTRNQLVVVRPPTSRMN